VSELGSKASSYGTAASGTTHEGALSTAGRRFAIVAARFNDAVVAKLIAGARAALRKAGAADEDVELYRCPGAMEIPGLARRVADTGRFDGIVCLGAVIRGATPHFDLVVNESARGVGGLAAEGRVAVSFGVLACDNLEQAEERTSEKDNRGADAALVAVEMADLYAKLHTEAAGKVEGKKDVVRTRKETLSPVPGLTRPGLTRPGK
jgi:6,7-dimethyl-8-ribityllumazine synthase